ncbi:MAG: SH3 domain-containing protein [Cyanobacteria bacterium P01_H01_bin.21]
MASKRFDLQNLLVGLTKFVLGVAIALFVISLAGVATARYFLTQLASAPERPVYDNDAPAQPQQASNPAPAPAAEQPQPQPSEPEQPTEAPDANVLYEVIVTYGAGLLVRAGAGADYETIDGIDYDETVQVLEESGRWFRVRTSSGVEGWIRGQGNTQRL